MDPEGNAQVLPSKLTMEIRKNDVFRHELAGGGGWGDPLERDVAAVLRDVRNELLTPAKAKADYGVVVDVESWSVDEPATERARAALRESRPAELPVVAWEETTVAADAAE